MNHLGDTVFGPRFDTCFVYVSTIVSFARGLLGYLYSTVGLRTLARQLSEASEGHTKTKVPSGLVDWLSAMGLETSCALACLTVDDKPRLCFLCPVFTIVPGIWGMRVTHSLKGFRVGNPGLGVR